MPSSFREAAAAFGLSEGMLPRQLCCEFDLDFPRGAHAELWRTSSVIVGMHPDQATEPVVDAALAAGKPFAVVPCCVFPHSNPHRRLANGSLVIEYDSLVLDEAISVCEIYSSPPTNLPVASGTTPSSLTCTRNQTAASRQRCPHSRAATLSSMRVDSHPLHCHRRRDVWRVRDGRWR